MTALEHFEELLEFETDCWHVHGGIEGWRDQGFALSAD
jgi:hypothetical protein